MATIGKHQFAQEESITNVRKSVRTAIEVFTHLEQSLLQGRFRESVRSYETMCDTLVGQRLWSLTVNDPEIDASFRELGELAARLFEMLSPYATISKKLMVLPNVDLGRNAGRTKESSAVTGDAAIVLNALKEFAKPMTITRLRSQSGLDRVRLNKALEELKTKHLMTASVAGGRTAYHLVTDKK